MAVIIGSARIDERGAASGGAVGDQKQTSTPDYKGEVSFQNFYVHSKGWYILRPKSDAHANLIATKMRTACNNKNIGYDQGGRYGVVKYGVATTTKTEADCSSLVRACVKEATGKDPGDFNTSNEASVLEKTGLFESKKPYTSGTTLYTGDVLVTKTKGHTVIVTDGAARVAAPSEVAGKTLCKTQKFEGRVTASELNVRTWAGTENPTCSFSPLKNGVIVSVCDEAKAADGGLWYYIKYKGKYGFVSAKYIAKH